MRLFIEPTEALLFRTGRPFDAGQDTFAESLFPPTPETLQGAVRATIASYWDTNKNIAQAFDDPELTSRIGDYNSYGRFRITGLGLGRYSKKETTKIERLFPPPAHLMKSDLNSNDDNEGEKKTRTYRLLPRRLEASISTNFPTGTNDYYLEPEQTPENELKPLTGWLTETDLLRALGGDDVSTIKTISKEDIYQEEPRLGIGIELGTKATEEGYLYQTVMIRMNHDAEQDYIYGFVVDVQLTPLSEDNVPLNDVQIQKELHLPETGWMTLGGEQRTAYFRVLSTPPKLTTRDLQKRTLLYLATPATFATGWKPSPRFAPLNTPITAALNHYESIGGWKLNPGDAKGGNKDMQRCVPAGSVYFYDKQVTTPQVLTDNGMEIGYGITYEGAW